MHDGMHYGPIRGRSQGHEPFIWKASNFQKQSPLPFKMVAGNWSLILKLEHNI